MIDLKKKPIPDPRRELVTVLAKIAEKREKEELFKAIEAESKLIQRYKRCWINAVIIALLTVIWIPIITIKEKSSAIWEISYFWGVIIPLAVTFLMLCEPPGKGFKFSNGASVKVKGLGWLKFIYYILAWVPWYSCIVLRFNVHPLKALWVTPLSLVVLIIFGLFDGKNDPNGTNRIYTEDYRTVRLRQSAGGLNPDALPPVFMNAANKDAIMRMSPQDWNLIGHRLRQAGYKNVLKKGR